MSESTSLQISEISSSGPSQPGGASIPLILSASNSYNVEKPSVIALPKLPSHRFRYTIWHELSSTSVTGDQLRAPRIRDGPEVKDKFFYKIRDDSCRKIHHCRRGVERRNYQNKTENWENATNVNLSYQELQHNYQKENFLRVLRRLISVQHLTLINNDMTDLSSVSLPCCSYMDISTGHIEHFKNLPTLPIIEELVLDDNHVTSLAGLDRLARSPLTTLSMRGTPVSFTLNYRQRVFASVPSLRVLDGVPCQPDDAIFIDEPAQEKTCSIC